MAMKMSEADDLFDQIEDLLDFPKEEDAVDNEERRGEDDGVASRSPAARATGGGGICTVDAEPSHHAQLEPLICDDPDVAQLEWLSNFFDDSRSPAMDHHPFACMAIKSSALAATGTLCAGAGIVKEEDEAFFSSCSPISVLEGTDLKMTSNNNNAEGSSSRSISSSSSSSASSAISFSSNGLCSKLHRPLTSLIPSRARSKRSRPSAAPRSITTMPIPLLEAPAALNSSSSYSDPESIAESGTPSLVQKKKAKKASVATTTDRDYVGEHDEPLQPTGPVRRCMHCQIEKTPQWRAGPMGPKTLCNACGVRYKSGRLFPEYRPAASPTFVPAIHSNSHKKVVEMRLKAASDDASCDLLKQIRHRDI